MFAYTDALGNGLSYARAKFLNRVFRRLGANTPSSRNISPSFEIGDRVEVETYLDESWDASAGTYIDYGIVEGIAYNPTGETAQGWHVLVSFQSRRRDGTIRQTCWQMVPVFDQQPDMTTTVRKAQQVADWAKNLPLFSNCD